MAEDVKKPSTSSVASMLERARTGAVASTGLTKEEAPKSSFRTGAVNSVSALPSMPRQVGISEVTKPAKTSPSQVLFKSARASFNFVHEGVQVRFQDGWLLTADAKLIAYIRENYVKSGTYVQEMPA